MIYPAAHKARPQTATPARPVSNIAMGHVANARRVISGTAFNVFLTAKLNELTGFSLER
jgi:hypothetical protein